MVSGELQYRECHVDLHEWRVKRKAQLEEEARKRTAEAERKERERCERLEKERIDRLLGEATSLQQANDIRTYVRAGMVTSAGSPHISCNELERWCSWALTQADRIDPIKRGALKADDGESSKYLGTTRLRSGLCSLVDPDRGGFGPHN